MKICSSTTSSNFCPCGQVVHIRFEKMNGLRKVQKKGLKVGMFLTRNERLICGRLIVLVQNEQQARKRNASMSLLALAGFNVKS